jgi:hypothetical protein
MTQLREAWLHWIWEQQALPPGKLSLRGGDTLEIIEGGSYNRDAGPDFSEAMLRINGTLWAGHVEMHVREEEWYEHKHHLDPAYDNVILHVVWQFGKEAIRRSDGSPVPCLELEPLVSARTRERIQILQGSLDWLACSGVIRQIPPARHRAMMDQALAARLAERSLQIQSLVQELGGDWEHAFFIRLARNMGFRVNAEAFEQLARSLHPNILARHRHNLFQLEALLFGQSGLLSGGKKGDGYQQQLAAEYRFLRHKYGLRPMKASVWKFMRMRPLNFPTLRIAQFAALWQSQAGLFAALMQSEKPDKAMQLLQAEASAYWHQHFRFGEEAPVQGKAIGKDATSNLLINTVAPFMFAYGMYRQDKAQMDKALGMLSGIAAENNRIIRDWMQAGVQPMHAGDSQALIWQREHMCRERWCMDCPAGAYWVGMGLTQRTG